MLLQDKLVSIETDLDASLEFHDLLSHLSHGARAKLLSCHSCATDNNK